MHEGCIVAQALLGALPLWQDSPMRFRSNSKARCKALENLIVDSPSDPYLRALFSCLLLSAHGCGRDVQGAECHPVYLQHAPEWPTSIPWSAGLGCRSTMRFESTTKILTKRILKYYRTSL